jgi:adenylosuccinate synthase
MTVAVLIGSQFGDEGKGKVTDFYAAEADMIVRFNGGNNAGHTIVVEGVTYKLHLMPSGAIQPNKHVVIGNGVVVDPGVLLQEMADLDRAGHPIDRLSVSDRAHLILSYHKLQDGIEEGLKGKLKAGTTMRGIGPTYQDKAARWGVRAGDLLDKGELRRKLEIVLPIKERVIRGLGGPEVEFDTSAVYEECMGYADRLGPYVEDTTVLINEAIEAGRSTWSPGPRAPVPVWHPRSSTRSSGSSRRTSVGWGPAPSRRSWRTTRESTFRRWVKSSGPPPAVPGGAAGWTWLWCATPTCSAGSPASP